MGKKKNNCMVSQPVWIGIAVGVFFVGIVIGYGIFFTTDQPDQMLTQTQLMQQIMMQSPQHRQQMMDALTQNPEDMRQWMANTEHVQEMSTVMRENHDFMMAMMSEIMNDPDLRLQMIGHMTEHPEAMKMTKQMMGPSMMLNQTMGPGGMMMDQNTMTQMMQDPQIRPKMINIMKEHVTEMQELLNSEISDDKFNQKMLDLMQKHMESMQNLMKPHSQQSMDMMNP